MTKLIFRLKQLTHLLMSRLLLLGLAPGVSAQEPAAPAAVDATNLLAVSAQDGRRDGCTIDAHLEELGKATGTLPQNGQPWFYVTGLYNACQNFSYVILRNQEAGVRVLVFLQGHYLGDYAPQQDFYVDAREIDEQKVLNKEVFPPQTVFLHERCDGIGSAGQTTVLRISGRRTLDILQPARTGGIPTCEKPRDTGWISSLPNRFKVNPLPADGLPIDTGAYTAYEPHSPRGYGEAAIGFSAFAGTVSCAASGASGLLYCQHQQAKPTYAATCKTTGQTTPGAVEIAATSMCPTTGNNNVLSHNYPELPDQSLLPLWSGMICKRQGATIECLTTFGTKVTITKDSLSATLDHDTVWPETVADLPDRPSQAATDQVKAESKCGVNLFAPTVAAAAASYTIPNASETYLPAVAAGNYDPCAASSWVLVQYTAQRNSGIGGLAKWRRNMLFTFTQGKLTAGYLIDDNQGIAISAASTGQLEVRLSCLDNINSRTEFSWISSGPQNDYPRTVYNGDCRTPSVEAADSTKDLYYAPPLGMLPAALPIVGVPERDHITSVNGPSHLPDDVKTYRIETKGFTTDRFYQCAQMEMGTYPEVPVSIDYSPGSSSTPICVSPAPYYASVDRQNALTSQSYSYFDLNQLQPGFVDDFEIGRDSSAAAQISCVAHLDGFACGSDSSAFQLKNGYLFPLDQTSFAQQLKEATHVSDW